MSGRKQGSRRVERGVVVPIDRSSACCLVRQQIAFLAGGLCTLHPVFREDIRFGTHNGTPSCVTV